MEWWVDEGVADIRVTEGSLAQIENLSLQLFCVRDEGRAGQTSVNLCWWRLRMS